VRSSAKKAKKRDARAVVASMRAAIARLDDEFVGEVVGVAQALDELRKALRRIEICLDTRELEKASRIGYGSVADNFIFLQRTRFTSRPRWQRGARDGTVLHTSLRCPPTTSNPRWR